MQEIMVGSTCGINYSQIQTEKKHKLFLARKIVNLKPSNHLAGKSETKIIMFILGSIDVH